MGEHSIEPEGQLDPPATRAKKKKKRVAHIFRNAEGHFSEDNAENRKKIEDLVNTTTSMGKDRFGNDWFSQITDNNKQLWAQVRNGKIINGGINDRPLTFDSVSGLSGKNRR